MNELLLMEDLKGLNNVIRHEGRKGQRWGIFGASGATRFQPGAVYAKGMADPNANDKTSNAVDSKQLNKKDKATTQRIKEMSDEELRKKTERLRLENFYEQAVQDQMRNTINRHRLESEYRNTLKSPKKKNKVISTFTRYAGKFADRVVDKTIETGINALVDVAKGKVAETKGSDYAEMLFKSNKEGKKGKK